MPHYRVDTSIKGNRGKYKGSEITADSRTKVDEIMKETCNKVKQYTVTYYV